MYYYAYRATTDKLNEALQRMYEAGDEPTLPFYFTGGRDWVIIVRKSENDK